VDRVLAQGARFSLPSAAVAALVRRWRDPRSLPQFRPADLLCRQRALASSAAGIAGVAGTCISFVLAALLIGLTGSLARAVALLAAGPLLALVIVAVGFPETAGRELEQTSAESDGAALPGPIPAADPVAQRDTAT
jgi:hypothetical protein